MRSIKQNFKRIIPLFICVSLVIACGGGKSVSKKGKSKEGFIKGKHIYEDETFSPIQSNIGRLTAMLAGEFVQYNNQNKEQVYRPWLVNNQKDSVVLYSIPVGEPNKVGYWMYHYQVMTSLPDEPIYEAFEEFIEINRDTIKSVYYEAPSDFNVPLEDLLKKHKYAFETVKLEKLEASNVAEKITYVRQNPLYFKGMTPMIKDDQNKGHYKRDHYEIRPSGILYKVNRYKKAADEEPERFNVDKFIKLQMCR